MMVAHPVHKWVTFLLDSTFWSSYKCTQKKKKIQVLIIASVELAAALKQNAAFYSVLSKTNWFWTCCYIGGIQPKIFLMFYVYIFLFDYTDKLFI